MAAKYSSNQLDEFVEEDEFQTRKSRYISRREVSRRHVDSDEDDEENEHVVTRKSRSSLTRSRMPPPPSTKRPTMSEYLTDRMEGNEFSDFSENFSMDRDRQNDSSEPRTLGASNSFRVPKGNSFRARSTMEGNSSGVVSMSTFELPRRSASNNSWAEQKSSSIYGDMENADKENSVNRTVSEPSSWTTASRSPSKKPLAAVVNQSAEVLEVVNLALSRVPQHPSRSRPTDDEENNSQRLQADGESRTTGSPSTSSFTDYSEDAEANGIVLARKSGKYDDEDAATASGAVLIAPTTGESTLIPVPSQADYASWGIPLVDESQMSKFKMAVPFVLKSHPHGTKTEHVQCIMLRDRSSLHGKMYPTYELILEDTKKKILFAKKMNMNRTSNYHMFDLTRGQVSGSKLTKKSGNYLGKLRATNMNRSEYVLVNHNSEREEVAGMMFERPSLFNHIKEGSQPRKMTVVVPHLDSNRMPIPNKLKENGEGTIVEAFKTPVGSNRVLTLETKDPVYDNGNYRLNFRGRVSVPSVKNFQLVSRENPDNIICQFGKVGEDRFHLDFKTPLNAFQAFAFAVCQFNL